MSDAIWGVDDGADSPLEENNFQYLSISPLDSLDIGGKVHGMNDGCISQGQLVRGALCCPHFLEKGNILKFIIF